MIYLANVVLNNNGTKIVKEVLTKEPIETAAKSKDVFVRATRGLSETQRNKTTIVRVDFLREIKGFN